jgi:hypothetical protein
MLAPETFYLPEVIENCIFSLHRIKFSTLGAFCGTFTHGRNLMFTLIVGLTIIASEIKNERQIHPYYQFGRQRVYCNSWLACDG